jgi:multidrug efflux pump subunit AcrA (membrane-fusion protein)
VVRTNRDEHTVQALRPGVLTEWLRNDGDIVGAGLPVARMNNRSEF